MHYPNNIQKSYTKIEVSHKNRGMNLENSINISNEYYLKNDIALIYKKPTPIGIVDVSYQNDKKIITKAYFKEPSTLDYNGLYKGKYIEFDAKVTKNSNSFPLANIHAHQIKHIRNIIKHGGIVFLIIEMNDNYYLLKGIDLINFIDNNERKSIPFDYIKDKGYILEYNYNKGLNYIDIVGGFINEKN